MSSTRTGILVTGSHRSGSTWLGRLLASADELHYVQEPFNIVAVQRWLTPRPDRQFLYLDDDSGQRYVAGIERILRLRYPLAAHLSTLPAPREARRMAGIARAASKAAASGAQPLIKDPIALFSTEWLWDRFGLEPVILVREPLAFVGSLKERGWTFDFNHWADQPKLMDGIAAPWAAEIRQMGTAPPGVVEQGILQWNVFYQYVADLRRRRPDAVVVSYEQLATDPQAQVPALFDRLGLGFGAQQQATLSALTDGSGGSSEGTSAIDVRRRSADAVDTWRKRLDESEIEAINLGTAKVVAQLADLSP